MIYAIMLCVVNVGCNMLGAPVYTYTFDSPEACLAKLPSVMGPALRGKSVSADGRLYMSKIEWLECDGKPTWTTVQPQAAQPPPTQTFTMLICKTDQPCKPFGEPLALLDVDCIQDMYKNLEDKSKYELLNNRIYAKGERYSWYECR